jgi:hypothetical protein
MRSDWLRQLAVGVGILTAGGVGGGLIRAADKPDHVIKSPTDILISDPTLLQGAKVETAAKYWIGVASEPAGAAMHAQLPDLPKGAGLVVQQVVADSPAAKAGIQPNDILFAAGDKSLGQVSELSAAIAAGKDAELPIKLLRGGKTMTITVKPEEQKVSGLKLNELAPDDKAVRLFVNQLQPDALGPLNLHDLKIATADGTTLTPWANKHELPDDMTVDIHREGKKPAKVTVKKGDQKWEINEDQLDKLPEDVRHEVEPLLGGGPERIRLNLESGPGLNNLSVGVPLDFSGVSASGTDAEIFNRLQKNVDEIDQRLAEMKRTIGELRAARQKEAQKPKDK